MKKILLPFFIWALAASAAFAQVNVVPQVGQINSIIRVPTYTATSVGLVPASSATDIFCITPGTSKSVAIRRITIAGTAGTAITTPFLLYRRVSRDTGGTAATSLALPVAVPHSPTDSASNSTLIAYTANPTVVDASPSLMDDLTVDLPVTTAAGGPVENTHTYGTSIDIFEKGIDAIKNTTQQLCVNLNGVTVATGVLQITMEWQEQ